LVTIARPQSSSSRIQRAGIGGFALVEPEWDEAERKLQLVVRQRRDLVEKCDSFGFSTYALNPPMRSQ
jgi:hypothetical protein